MPPLPLDHSLPTQRNYEKHYHIEFSFSSMMVSDCYENIRDVPHGAFTSSSIHLSDLNSNLPITDSLWPHKPFLFLDYVKIIHQLFLLRRKCNLHNKYIPTLIRTQCLSIALPRFNFSSFLLPKWRRC